MLHDIRAETLAYRLLFTSVCFQEPNVKRSQSGKLLMPTKSSGEILTRQVIKLVYAAVPRLTTRGQRITRKVMPQSSKRLSWDKDLLLPRVALIRFLLRSQKFLTCNSAAFGTWFNLVSSFWIVFLSYCVNFIKCEDVLLETVISAVL